MKRCDIQLKPTEILSITIFIEFPLGGKVKSFLNCIIFIFAECQVFTYIFMFFFLEKKNRNSLYEFKLKLINDVGFALLSFLKHASLDFARYIF